MRKSGALWGALLIFIGIVWILGANNLIHIDLTGAVSTLWPVFLIAAGITLFLKREAHLPRVILWVLVFALIGGYGIYLGANEKTLESYDKTFEMRPNIDVASLKVNLGTARFELGASGGALADIHTNAQGIRYEYIQGPTTKIEFNQKMQFGKAGRKQTFKADLSKDVPWQIELNTGATSGVLDFSEIRFGTCTINTGVCDLTIDAGSKSEDSRIVINGGAVTLNLHVPEEMGLKIVSNSAATKVNGDITMQKQGNMHLSENYHTASGKLVIEIASGVANINANR